MQKRNIPMKFRRRHLYTIGWRETRFIGKKQRVERNAEWKEFVYGTARLRRGNHAASQEGRRKGRVNVSVPTNSLLYSRTKICVVLRAVKGECSREKDGVTKW